MQAHAWEAERAERAEAERALWRTLSPFAPTVALGTPTAPPRATDGPCGARSAAAAPAVGMMKLHLKQQSHLVEEALK